MISYRDKILGDNSMSFDKIKAFALEEIKGIPKSQQDKLFGDLERGVAILETHEQLCYYLKAFGNMHQAKLQDAFSKIPDSIFSNPFEVIDWGCGQAMGVINLFDYLNSKGLAANIQRVTLIEPSSAAIERGVMHSKAYCSDSVELISINDYFNNISPEQIKSLSYRPVIHIFSNILDVQEVDLKSLANLVDDAVNSNNYLLCVGPVNPGNKRLDQFLNYFDRNKIETVCSYESKNFGPWQKWTYKLKVYELDCKHETHLIPISYYPPVQFLAAYELDEVRKARLESKNDFSQILSTFEVAAPFDIGASVYENVNPILAVLHNIVCRGLPTKSSLLIEEKIQQVFKRTRKSIKYGEISYESDSKFDYKSIENIALGSNEINSELSENDKLELQLLLSPIAVARFHKVLIEAILIQKLNIDAKKWDILVEEQDVPFAHLAIEDFRQLFHNLCCLSQDFSEWSLPVINLTVISNEQFSSSPLHGIPNVLINPDVDILNKTYDFVLVQSILKSTSSIESFSRFKVKSNCYFNLRRSSLKRIERTVYTSDLIKFKPLVESDQRGNYKEHSEIVDHLTYFLQLLFRKEHFRPGQLPILDRAVRNLPVIGLLPTGGGKSLTYQIAAMLQPGVTMIVDPLKALMKDQYDGLIAAGIDCAAFLNSTQSRQEKDESERRLQSSELLFMFLSPERLSISKFRERLVHMHDYGVYFSYGVIDEVHCVSEWGHDFRFSYLHLGRNLYNYVKAKNGTISLFGLTATASFDVLADVERELSGNGAFPLDADVIVRSENTNRLELQYKVEKVKIDFSEDKYFDKNNVLDEGLPKAVNIGEKWTMFQNKSSALDDFIEKIPAYLKEAQSKESIKRIKEHFKERQNLETIPKQDLSFEINDDYFMESELYSEAGIVFCPHVNTTPLSVNINTQRVGKSLVKDVASFSGKDDDNTSMKNLEKFRDNQSPLMIATKAFGMGIDKPNVRFTLNMNYSSSLEAFVQEAGRAGRDRKIALATILLSDYHLVKINSSFQDSTFPLQVLRNKWFKKEDLDTILSHYNISVQDEYIIHATPENDIVQLRCKQDHKMFAFNKCSSDCALFTNCELRNVSRETKGWRSEKELIQDLRTQGVSLSKKNFEYLNPDYQNVMFFFGNSFKGDLIEKQYMNQLMNKMDVFVSKNNFSNRVSEKGFLTSVLDATEGEAIHIDIPYNEKDYADLSKAIYRMCCIQLILDFTQNYVNKEFRIIAERRSPGGYFEGVRTFLLRYYNQERADIEMEKVRDFSLKREFDNKLQSEIYKCLAYLTEFVYDKISEKRKRAIDDMRNFCIEGVNRDGETWLEANEKLKDFIFYYFNSKYAKSDYVTDSGEAFSLLVDTDEGKFYSLDIINKYFRVIDDEIVGVGTPIDNVKHLYGAVRLISRSLTDTNPALRLLECFCLSFLGTRGNENLEIQLYNSYSEGLIDAEKRERKNNNEAEFWEFMNIFNTVLSDFLEEDVLSIMKDETMFLIHNNIARLITNKYIA